MPASCVHLRFQRKMLFQGGDFPSHSSHSFGADVTGAIEQAISVTGFRDMERCAGTCMGASSSQPAIDSRDTLGSPQCQCKVELLEMRARPLGSRDPICFARRLWQLHLV